MAAGIQTFWILKFFLHSLCLRYIYFIPVAGVHSKADSSHHSHFRHMTNMADDCLASALHIGLVR